MYFDEVENILESNSTYIYKNGRGINNVKLSEKNIINRMDNEDFQKKEELLKNNSLMGWKLLISKKFKNIIPGKKISSKDVIETKKAFENGVNNDSLVKNMANKFMEKEIAGIKPYELRNYQERSQRQATHAMANKFNLTGSNTDANNKFNVNNNFYFKPTDGSLKPYGGMKGLDNIMKIRNNIYFIESKQAKIDSDIRSELKKMAYTCSKFSNSNLPVICTISVDYPLGLNKEERNNQKIEWKNFINLLQGKYPNLKILFTNKSGINRMIRNNNSVYIPEKIVKSRAKVIKDAINNLAGTNILQ